MWSSEEVMGPELKRKDAKCPEEGKAVLVPRRRETLGRARLARGAHTGYSQPFRYARRRSLLASGSPTIVSFAPSHWTLRPSFRLSMPSSEQLDEWCPASMSET